MCGNVRYDLSAEPLFTAICHCRQCQRQTASAFSVVVGVPEGSFTLHGTTKIFVDIGDSGQSVARHFCPDCGSPILSMLGALPGMVIIKAGTMDNFAALTPQIEVFCENALPYLPALAGTKRFARSNLES